LLFLELERTWVPKFIFLINIKDLYTFIMFDGLDLSIMKEGISFSMSAQLFFCLIRTQNMPFGSKTEHSCCYVYAVSRVIQIFIDICISKNGPKMNARSKL